MRNALLAATLCLGLFSTGAHAGEMTVDELKDCFKLPMKQACTDQLEMLQKAMEDISNGRKPTLALPISPSALPLGDLAKLFSIE
jgi:hypothetical protein